jgi:hypothetical protein
MDITVKIIITHPNVKAKAVPLHATWALGWRGGIV